LNGELCLFEDGCRRSLGSPAVERGFRRVLHLQLNNLGNLIAAQRRRNAQCAVNTGGNAPSANQVPIDDHSFIDGNCAEVR
jgi:hypothetical protein